MSPRDHRLVAIHAALRLRKQVNELRRDFRKYYWLADRLDYEDPTGFEVAINGHEHLANLERSWREAIEATHWSYFYMTREEVTAARDAANSRRAAA